MMLSDKTLEVSYNVTTDDKAYKIKLNLLSRILDPNLNTDSYKITSTNKKMELKFRKQNPGLWASLEDNVTEPKNKTHTNTFNDEYFENELKEEEECDDKFVKLLQDIYSNGDDNVKRSMVKSMTESSGQVLSTNWNREDTT